MTEVVQTYLTSEVESRHIQRLFEVSEAEAREKLCVGPPLCGLQLRGVPGAEERRCAGSRCMAWRWGLSLIEQTIPLEIDPNTYMVKRVHDGQYLPMQDRKHIDLYRPEGEGWELVTPFPHSGSMEIRRYQREHTKRGYCGFMERK